jgi:hypothetical protein
VLQRLRKLLHAPAKQQRPSHKLRQSQELVHSLHPNLQL